VFLWIDSDKKKMMQIHWLGEKNARSAWLTENAEKSLGEEFHRDYASFCQTRQAQFKEAFKI
jgi:hypothetical protein